ncbi:MAG: hypothetical protein COS89_05850 [Deltaproteobacteria bacterium CG07_land_8_20_14_0_80_38_7]|nr:MAG: hypothetical protein COS89_05850 [Deltaproteobacteria bacterium CG07_land_8_20_14_0_80_38_7]
MIHDVLKHYTTYKAFFGLIKSVEDDPQVKKKKAAKELARYMMLHPHNIAQKAEIMVEHFRNHTKHCQFQCNNPQKFQLNIPHVVFYPLVCLSYLSLRYL